MKKRRHELQLLDVLDQMIDAHKNPGGAAAAAGPAAAAGGGRRVPATRTAAADLDGDGDVVILDDGEEPGAEKGDGEQGNEEDLTVPDDMPDDVGKQLMECWNGTSVIWQGGRGTGAVGGRRRGRAAQGRLEGYGFGGGFGGAGGGGIDDDDDGFLDDDDDLVSGGISE